MGMLTNLPLWKSPDEDYWKRDYTWYAEAEYSYTRKDK
jgi:hypothetical protein